MVTLSPTHRCEPTNPQQRHEFAGQQPAVVGAVHGGHHQRIQHVGVQVYPEAVESSRLQRSQRRASRLLGAALPGLPNRAADCAWHTRDTDTGPAAGRRGGPRPVVEAVRCGGPDGVRGPCRKAVADRGDVCPVRGRHYRLPCPGPAPPPAHPVPARISRSSIAAAMAPSSVLSAPPRGRQRPRRLTGGAARLGQRRFGAGPGYGPGPSLRLPRGSVPVSAPCTRR